MRFDNYKFSASTWAASFEESSNFKMRSSGHHAYDPLQTLSSLADSLISPRYSRRLFALQVGVANTAILFGNAQKI